MANSYTGLGGGQHITLRNSEIVSDGETIFISNNNNEFFALDIRTGVIKWKQQINSEIRPVVVSNYIITISNEGLLIIINKNDGNILRINNILKNIKKKKRKEYYPVGFVISDNKIYLTTFNGRLFIINFSDASIYKVLTLDKEKLQTPVYFNKELYKKLRNIQLPISYKKKKFNYFIKNNFNKNSARKKARDILKRIQL